MFADARRHAFNDSLGHCDNIGSGLLQPVVPTGTATGMVNVVTLLTLSAHFKRQRSRTGTPSNAISAYYLRDDMTTLLKQRAKRLRNALASDHSLQLTHSQSLELIAKEENFPHWDAASASINSSGKGDAPQVGVDPIEAGLRNYYPIVGAELGHGTDALLAEYLEPIAKRITEKESSLVIVNARLTDTLQILRKHLAVHIHQQRQATFNERSSAQDDVNRTIYADYFPGVFNIGNHAGMASYAASDGAVSRHQLLNPLLNGHDVLMLECTDVHPYMLLKQIHKSAINHDDTLTLTMLNRLAQDDAIFFLEA